jgi:DNA transposition AAA+ family ATPase
MHKPTPTFEPLAQPAEFGASYKDADRAQVASIINWLNTQNDGVTDKKQLMTQSWLAKLARVNASTVNLVLGGKYPSPPTDQLRKLLAAIEDFERKQESGGQLLYVKTGIYRTIKSICERASSMKSFGVCSGYVGVGKTSALKEYLKHNPNAKLIEATPSMSVGVLLDTLLAALKIGVSERYGKSRSQDARFASIVDELKGTSTLLIFDEAETMTHRCLHILRRIRDMANVGIVLAGTERLTSLIMPEHGEFDQIRSRVCLWPATIRAISRADADALSSSALADQGELAGDVLDALWAYTRGSARMLMENLIPAVRDYGINQGLSLDAQLVHDVAQQTLNLKPA